MGDYVTREEYEKDREEQEKLSNELIEILKIHSDGIEKLYDDASRNNKIIGALVKSYLGYKKKTILNYRFIDYILNCLGKNRMLYDDIWGDDV